MSDLQATNIAGMGNPTAESDGSMTQEALRDEPMKAVMVDDLLIDEVTGEVIEGWPAELRDVPGKIEYLTMRERQAAAAESAWKQYHGFLRQAIGKLLDEADLKSLRTRYGTPGWRTRTTREGVMDRLPLVQHKYELSLEQVTAILFCAKALKADLLEKLKGAPIFTAAQDAIDALIDESTSAWVQVTAARPDPPEIRHETREQADD